MKKLHSCAFAAAGVIATTSASAIEPAGIPVGVFSFVPTLNLGTAYDDNFRGKAAAESSWITTIQPNFLLATENRNSVYQLSYSLAHSYFHSSQDDNNTDHFVNGSANFEFDARNRLALAVGYSRTTDVDSDRALTAPDEFSQTTAGFGYGYGADSALMNLDVGYNFLAKRTENNINADREYDSHGATGTFYYRMAPKTKLLAEIRQTEYDYLNVNRDSSNTEYLAGLTWEATAFTTGTIKAGRTEKDFDSAALGEKDASSWEVGIAWQPLTYSTFTLTSRRGIDEGDNGASFILSEAHTIGWNHQWSSRISSDVELSTSEQEYSTARVDDIDTAGIGMTLAIDRWIDATLGYRYTDNTSTQPNEDYDRNVYSIGLQMSL